MTDEELKEVVTECSDGRDRITEDQFVEVPLPALDMPPLLVEGREGQWQAIERQLARRRQRAHRPGAFGESQAPHAKASLH